MVDRAALEMPCPSPGPGFESRTLRQKVCDSMSTGFFYGINCIIKREVQICILKENLIAQMITATGRELYYHIWEKPNSHIIMKLIF